MEKFRKLKRRILIFTGSRGEWGYLRPVISQLNKNGNETAIVVSNMHVDERFGNTKSEIVNDGFEIYESIYMNIVAPNEIGWTKSLGLLMLQIPDILDRFKPDIVLLAGDRAETFIFSIASFYSNYFIAHIQAGELSGHKDGMARHAIGKLVHIHLASNYDAKERLIRLGEPKFRIFQTGAPQLDDIINSKIKSDSIDVIKKKLRINTQRKFALCILHSSSDDPDINNYVKLINTSLREKGFYQVWILPNSDSGSEQITLEILKLSKNELSIAQNFARANFIELLRNAELLIGNSSCGILEAPAVGLPSINLGVRQKGRVQAKSVFSILRPNNENLGDTIKESLKIDRKQNFSLFGDGNSSSKICDILEEIVLDAKIKDKFLEE